MLETCKALHALPNGGLMPISESHVFKQDVKSSWWFEPISKIFVKLHHFPKKEENIHNIWNYHLENRVVKDTKISSKILRYSPGWWFQSPLKNMLVKMGWSSPIFGVTIQKIFELPAPSLCLSLQGFFTSLTPKRWIHFPGKNMCLILQTWEIYSIWAYGTKKPGRRETMVVNGPLHSINLRGLWLENGPWMY